MMTSGTSAKLLSKNINSIVVRRTFSLGNTNFCDKYKLPVLMDMPNVVTPNPRKTIINWFQSKALITPYFDNDFSIKEFDTGAHFAATKVSRCLAKGDLTSLEHIVSPEALETVGNNLRLV